MAKITREDALEYHRLKGKPGKLAIVPTKPMDTQRDLGLAYTPGVADPVLEIEKNPEDAYEYTSKGNLVAVVSNGTAILGLGDRGALASKPVMEGKACCSSLRMWMSLTNSIRRRTDHQGGRPFPDFWRYQSRRYQSPRMFLYRRGIEEDAGYSRVPR
jgi:hypothetical protein